MALPSKSPALDILPQTLPRTINENCPFRKQAGGKDRGKVAERAVPGAKRYKTELEMELGTDSAVDTAH